MANAGPYDDTVAVVDALRIHRHHLRVIRDLDRPTVAGRRPVTVNLAERSPRESRCARRLLD
jgi:hypothetical protein